MIAFPLWTKRHLVAGFITLAWCVALYFWIPFEPVNAGMSMVIVILGLISILWSDWFAESMAHGLMESLASDVRSAGAQGPIVEFLGWITMFAGIVIILWNL